MKKETKTKLLGGLGLLFGVVLLSGCTANFCSNIDKANMAYPYEQGVTVYCSQSEIPSDYQSLAFNPIAGNTQVFAYIPVNTSGYFAAKKADYLTGTIITAAVTNKYTIPAQLYFRSIDQLVLNAAIKAAGISDFATITAAQINPYNTPDCVGNESSVTANNDSILRNFGYLKFYSSTGDTLWGNWNEWNTELKNGDLAYWQNLNPGLAATDVGASICPSDDFMTLYQNDVNSKISSQRSCISTRDGAYGHYGASSNWAVAITTKSWGDAWATGDFLSGLIVWPVAWMVDQFAYGMDPALSGWGQIWAIVFVTLIVRAFVLLCTFKSTMDQQKTQALQPELAKLQAKYPNSNTNQAQQQRMAQEQMALYKRNKVNPASMFLAMLVQFPVFIAVWGALQSSAVLSSGEVLGLRLSDTIRDVLFNVSDAWYLNAHGWWTALVLFLLMSVFQWLAMMLPQWMTKARTKKQSRVSANPAADKNTQTMKWVSYGMLAFTIFMGFALPAAMGVYWAIGALISMIQTVVTQKVMSRKQTKEKR